MSTEDGAFRWALALSLTGLLAVLVAAAVRFHNAPWKVAQRTFAKTSRDSNAIVEIREVRTCEGSADRCQSCHLGSNRVGNSLLPLPFSSHGPGLEGHDPSVLGCSACHGGTPRALDDRAHFALGEKQRDPLLSSPHVQASCGKCHVPGSVAGDERLRQGARLYLGLGCSLCHPIGNDGKGGLDFGPDLAAAGRASVESLKRSLFEPEADFPGSTMPSFRLALEGEALALESLVIYLESLPLGRGSSCNERDPNRALVRAPCVTCHAADMGKANGRLEHRCLFILERRQELACAQCHRADMPKGRQECPLISQHRSACAVCHD